MTSPATYPTSESPPIHTYTSLGLSSVQNAWCMTASLFSEGALVEELSATDLLSVESKLLEWTSDRPVVVHRLGQFEECELGVSLVSTVLATSNPQLIDSHQLSRILIPRLRDHNLETVALYLGVSNSAPDVSASALTGHCFLSLQEELIGFDLETLSSLSRLSHDTESPFYDLFMDAQQYALKRVGSKRSKQGCDAGLIIPTTNAEGGGFAEMDLWSEFEEDSDSSSGSNHLLHTDEIVSVFSDGGAIDTAMERFEHRPQQLSMVRAVTEAINNAEFLMVEAGTGTGKSLSYLVPAIYWAVKNDERVVISTNTKNLQEQLFFKDVPFLMKTLGVDFRATLLKGRSNYLCPDRWQQVMSQPEDHLSRREREEALPLVIWRSETETGDISENLGFNDQAGRSLWSKVNGEGGACPRCMFQEHCFVNQVRAKSAMAHLVIINHALLFSDVASDNVVLSDYSHLIIDEAHNLERIAVQHMTVEVGPWRVRNMMQKLFSRDGTDSGCLATLKFRAEKTPMKQLWKDQLSSATGRAIAAVTALDVENDTFFADVSEQVLKTASGRSGTYAKSRYTVESSLAQFLQDLVPGLLDKFSALRDTLGQLGAVLSEISDSWMADREEFVNTISSCLERTREIEEDLSSLVSADGDNSVYWVEASERSSASCLLVAAPLNVSEQLHDILFSKMRSVVLTSATLAVGEKFAYAARRIGVDRLEQGRLKTFQIGSPFDYETQSLVCVPSGFPKPRDDGHQQAVTDLIQGLVFAARRSTLVLFTSYSMLNRTYKDLEQPFGRLGIPLMAQGISGPRTLILDRFRSTPGSVLLGTDSFWEGIDVPGEALELLVLVKLPFAVPSEPVIEAQIEQLDQAGRNSFMEFLVPEAVIKFRQGFGRLIRSGSDRGAVVILDPRVIATRYGGLFINSLPTGHSVYPTADDLVDGVTGWFDTANTSKPMGV